MNCGAVARALEKAGEIVQCSRLQHSKRNALGEASLLVEEVQPALVDMDPPVELLGILHQTLQTIAEASQVPHCSG
jgi:hypothetical protein